MIRLFEGQLTTLVCLVGVYYMNSKAAYVGTFHKTGTVLLGLILGELQKGGFIKLWRSDWVEEEPVTWDVNFHYHSEFMFGEEYTRIPDSAKIVISVRDPRDLLVSGTRYHCDSKENWLHVPRSKFNGMTYQERINALSSWEEKLLFEMQHSSGNVIRKMLQVPFEDSRVIRVRLEDLMVDTDLEVFEVMFRHIGFEDARLDAALEFATKLSLFSKPKSVHSRGGYPGEWRERMPTSVQKEFHHRFPNAAELLGYYDN